MLYVNICEHIRGAHFPDISHVITADDSRCIIIIMLIIILINIILRLFVIHIKNYCAKLCVKYVALRQIS